MKTGAFVVAIAALAATVSAGCGATHGASTNRAAAGSTLAATLSHLVSSPLIACDDDSVDKRERKAAIRYLRDLLNEWDPIGGGHVPPGEYDCLIGLLLSKLTAGAGQSQISEFLQGELEDHFGLDPDGLDVDGMANRLVAWWAAVG